MCNDGLDGPVVVLETRRLGEPVGDWGLTCQKVDEAMQLEVGYHLIIGANTSLAESGPEDHLPV